MKMIMYLLTRFWEWRLENAVQQTFNYRSYICSVPEKKRVDNYRVCTEITFERIRCNPCPIAAKHDQYIVHERFMLACLRFTGVQLQVTTHGKRH